jgi:hypothetical protein
MIRAYRLLFVIISILFATSAASAQVQVTTGTPPFGSFGGGPDVINLANLNSHISIPVRHKAGRGTDFTYDLSYDSAVWYPVGASGSQTWQPVTNWGWRGQTEMAIGYITYNHTTTNCTLDVFPRQYGIVDHYSGWVYHDSFGVPHSFALNVYSNECTGVDTSGTATAWDGSGYSMTADAGPSATVFSSSGKVINAPLLNASAIGKVTDRNGNQISISTGGVFTDTLGTTALTVTGGAPNPLNFAYTAPSGATATVKMNYTSYTVKTYFGISGIAEYGPTAISLVSSVVLPDGSQYTFMYEPTPVGAACTPLTGTTQCVTARIASVKLPTGGTLSYAYSGGNNGIFSDGSAAILTRTTPDGTWIYARTQGTAPASTTLVTDPQSNLTQILFQGIYETQRRAYQGSTAGTLLQTVNTCYNGSASPCTGTAITLPITRRTQIIQLPNSAGKQAEYDAYYNTYGLQTEEDDYDFGSGGPQTTPLKKTLITYASLGNGIVDRPASITVQDGAGTTKAQTTFVYDAGTPATTSGTPQHVAISGSRGNATTVQNLVQGTTFLTKTISYWDTGTVKTATDVNGAVTDLPEILYQLH